MKVTYSVAASQDGYIARADGDVSWLEEMGVSTQEAGLDEFFARVGGLVMGRQTYDFIFDYGSWPYEDKPAWVCTHTKLKPLVGANLKIARSIDQVIEDADSSGIGHLWLLGGGQLASSFLTKGLLSEVHVTELPIKLGTGIPLFAAHSLEELPCESRNVTDQGHFRQIKIALEGGSGKP